MQYSGRNDHSLSGEALEVPAQVRITRRLINYLSAKGEFLQVALVKPHLDELYLDIFANGKATSYTALPLRDCAALPIKSIQKSYQTGRAISLITPESHTAFILPLVDGDAKAGVLYLVSNLSQSELTQRIKKLDTITSLLAMSLLQSAQQKIWEEVRQQRDYIGHNPQVNASYLKAIVQNSPALVVVADVDGSVRFCSEKLSQMCGVQVGSSIDDAFPDEFTSAIRNAMELRDSTLEKEVSVAVGDGVFKSYLLTAFPLRDETGQLMGVCAMGTDISARKQSELELRNRHSQLNHLVYYDSLTGLPNRTLFESTLTSHLTEAKRNKSRLALLLLDLDRFKNANDSLGHDVGDELLKEIAVRLKRIIRKRDIVARIGGDEFAIVIDNVQDPESLDRLAQKILAELEAPIIVGALECLMTASLGIALFPDAAYQPRDLLKHAEVAMYQAKATGKNRYQFYTHALSSTAIDAFQIENDLRKAIISDQLYLLYQPQVDMATGELMGVEALVRWQHPTKGSINPVHFISMAEETGLIVPLGNWVIRAACRQQREWLARGIDVGKIAVNISARQLSQPNFVDGVKQVFTEEGLAPEHIEFELTENSAMETASDIIGMMTKMNAMGLSLAIDDFGTGYSSLAYLKRFPVHKLKIDRSFIDELVTDVNDAVIAQSIIGLAHNMQLQVIAEGVENTDQQDWLIQRGCRLGQGFLYSPPIEAETLEEKYFAPDGSKKLFKTQGVKPVPSISVVSDGA